MTRQEVYLAKVQYLASSYPLAWCAIPSRWANTSRDTLGRGKNRKESGLQKQLTSPLEETTASKQNQWPNGNAALGPRTETQKLLLRNRCPHPQSVWLLKRWMSTRNVSNTDTMPRSQLMSEEAGFYPWQKINSENNTCGPGRPASPLSPLSPGIPWVYKSKLD